MVFSIVSTNGDGCTFWFDGLGQTSWRHCCEVHDLAYASGVDKITADLDLAQCVAQTGNGPMALIILMGVTIAGWWFYKREKRR